MNPLVFLLNGQPVFSPPGGGGNWSVNNLVVAGTLNVVGASTFSSGTFSGLLTAGSGQINILDANVNLVADASNLNFQTYAGKGFVWSTGGTQKMALTNSGNLGVGTSSPFSKLNVQADGTTTDVGQFVICGATNTSKRFSFGFNTTGDYATIQALIAGVGYYPLAVQPNGGNLLVGTTTDNGNKLQIAGPVSITPTSSDTGLVVQTTTTANPSITLIRNSATMISMTGLSNTGHISGNGTLWLGGNNNAEDFKLDSSGNATFAGAVGIAGSIQAGFKLDVTGLTILRGDLYMGAGNAIRLGNAYVAGAPAATGYVTIKDSNGNTYKVLVST